MLAIQVTRAVPPELAIAALIVAVSVLVRMITRIALYLLAVVATRKALEDLGSSQADAVAVRAHRLAVLEAILAALPAHDGARLQQAAASRRFTLNLFHPAFASRICNTWMALASCPARQGSSGACGESARS
jgi:hypothetical protein